MILNWETYKTLNKETYVKDVENGKVLCVELPGVERENIKVKVKHDSGKPVLHITAKQSEEQGKEIDVAYVYSLDSVFDLSNIKPTLSLGILKVNLSYNKDKITEQVFNID